MDTESIVGLTEVAPPPGIAPTLGRPTWLDLPGGPVLAYLHAPPSGQTHSTGVLLCPPFGLDDEMSYRGRRTWLDVLAADGFASARFDLPGTGDSGGSPRDPDRMDAWTEAVSGAAQWLRERTGCSRVAALGMGLGGLLAWRAAAAGAPIDDLVLWAVPDSGRRLLREIRIQAGIVSSDSQSEGTLVTAGMEAVGYALTDETVRGLLDLRLSELTLPNPGARRILLLSRDGLATDKRLGPDVEQRGMALSVADVAGWETLMVDPEFSQPPVAAIAETLSWLKQGEQSTPVSAQSAEPGAPTVVAESDHAMLRVGDATVREEVLRFERGPGAMLGVLCEPVDADNPVSLCVILLNAAGIRRTGPNRNWVELSRRWASRGVTTLRMDVEGFGDSDGDPRPFLPPDGPYHPDRTAQLLFVLDELERRGVAKRFAVLGLCTNAYLAMHAALDSRELAGVFLLNQNVIFWAPQLEDDDLTIKALDSLRGRTWQKLIHGDFTLAEIQAQIRKLNLGRIVVSLRQNADRRTQTNRVFDRLRERGTETLFLFGQHEPLFDRMERDGQVGRLDQYPNVTIARLTPTNELVPAGDHTFRTISLQHELHARLDEALERTIARAGL